MKKHFASLIFSVLAFSCSKDKVDDSSETTEDLRMANSAITNIYATGDVAEQTPEEAKKTIFGKWNLGSYGSSAKSALRSECSFESLEFTDESYLIKLSDANSQRHQIYGTYDFEEVDNKVVSVQLSTYFEGVSFELAEITDIVVEENNGELEIDFTFTFLMNLDDFFPCTNNLSQSYSAEKDEPMEGTLEADEDSTHYKIVGKYSAKSYSDLYGNTLEDFFLDSCIEYDYNYETGEETEYVDENCIPADELILELSTFGTYLFMELAQNTPIYIEAGEWSLSSDETSLKVTDPEGEIFVVSITQISNEGWTMTIEDDEDLQTINWEKE